MYCVRCGIKLADTEKHCPLCDTVVYHPDILLPDTNPLYPENAMPPKARRSVAVAMLATVACIVAGITMLVCDLQIYHGIHWSDFAIGALLIGYISLILPLWFRKPNPVIFVPTSFACVILYLLYICLATNGSWFFPFALPVTGGFGLSVCAVVTLLHYLKKGHLFIFGACAMIFGLLLLMTECLANICFQIPHFVGWSLYPLPVLVLLGGFLIFLGICRPAREAMERLFFI